MKQLTHTKWYLNGENEPSTGKQVSVDFSPSTGVKKIEVYAVQRGQNGNPDLKIDITEAEVNAGFDAVVEAWTDWDSKYADEEVPVEASDLYWNAAKRIARTQARSFRTA